MTTVLKRLGMLALAGGAVLLGDSPGIHPRPNAQQYGASVRVPNATVAAAALSADEVKHSFTTDLSKGYVVLEVAVYPDRDGNVKISPEDFMLKFAGQGALIRPSEPAVIASAMRPKSSPAYGSAAGRSTIDIVPTASVERVSEVYTDPTTGKRKTDSGWVTSTGVAVSGPNHGPPAMSGPGNARDRETIEAELADKSLPEGTIGQPTAGYLYFPTPKGIKKNGSYELQYLGQSSNIKLSVPRPASH